MRLIRRAVVALLPAALSIACMTPAAAQISAQGMIVLDGTRTPQTLCAVKLTDGSIAECKITIDTTGARVDPATKQLQQSLLSQLGSPFQAGGLIGNTAFGISGSLPAGINAIGTVGITTLPSLPAGSNIIGSIGSITGTVPLPQGAATDATLATANALATAANALLTSANTLNASFSRATLLVAGTDYTASAFRAVNVTCTSSGSANLTLIGTGSAVLPYTFTSGPSYQIAFQLKSIDAIPNGCVLEGLN